MSQGLDVPSGVPDVPCSGINISTCMCMVYTVAMHICSYGTSFTQPRALQLSTCFQLSTYMVSRFPLQHNKTITSNSLCYHSNYRPVHKYFTKYSIQYLLILTCTNQVMLHRWLADRATRRPTRKHPGLGLGVEARAEPFIINMIYPHLGLGYDAKWLSISTHIHSTNVTSRYACS